VIGALGREGLNDGPAKMRQYLCRPKIGVFRHYLAVHIEIQWPELYVGMNCPRTTPAANIATKQLHFGILGSPSIVERRTAGLHLSSAMVCDISNLAPHHVAWLAAKRTGLEMACQKTRDLIF
jgi:hypothetical protein